MIRKLFFILLTLLAVMATSCGKNYREVSSAEFTEKLLPKLNVKHLVVENNENLIIYTEEKTPYKIEIDSPTRLNETIDAIRSKNKNSSITYISEAENFQLGLFIWQMIYRVIPILILIHVILLWITLRKIIKSEKDHMEKMLYAIISIFFPFFGSLIYLTTKQNG